MYLLYSCCFTLAFLMALPYFLVRGFLQKKYFSSFRQRLGRDIPVEPSPGGIWIHAVSVGEVLAIVPLATALRARFPAIPLTVSTTTHTGRAVAGQRLGQLADILYFPFDWRFSVERVLNRVLPSTVLIAETEIWPNFLKVCSERSIPVLLVNGRISDRSFHRYLQIRWFIERSLRLFDRLCMQTESDRGRILRLGAPPGRTEVCGNLKYDLQVPEGIEPWLERYRDILGLRDKSLLLVAGSTMEEEEEQVLAAFHHLKKENPSAVLILAPRHPERFGEVENLLTTRGFQFQKRSSLDGKNTVRQGNIILLDSIGELANLYALADLVFVGGSLVPRGGHNLLEPALFRNPIVFGPHMNNFREIADYFLSHQGAIRVRDEAELSLQLLRLARDPQLRGRLGEKAFQILQASSGATRRILDHVESVLDRKDRRPESKELR